MMATWTKEELENAYPVGSVNVQHNHDVRPMTPDEWSAWIDAQVGTDKPEPDA